MVPGNCDWKTFLASAALCYIIIWLGPFLGHGNTDWGSIANTHNNLHCRQSHTHHPGSIIAVVGPILQRPHFKRGELLRAWENCLQTVSVIQAMSVRTNTISVSVIHGDVC